MNRRRSEDQRFPAFCLLAVLIAFIGVTTGGALHAIFRNDQIGTERKISTVRQRIEEHRLDIQMIEVRRERLIDRYEIRETLRGLDSGLVPVSHGVVEKVEPLPARDLVPVASRS